MRDSVGRDEKFHFRALPFSLWNTPSSLSFHWLWPKMPPFCNNFLISVPASHLFLPHKPFTTYQNYLSKTQIFLWHFLASEPPSGSRRCTEWAWTCQPYKVSDCHSIHILLLLCSPNPTTSSLSLNPHAGFLKLLTQKNLNLFSSTHMVLSLCLEFSSPKSQCPGNELLLIL